MYIYKQNETFVDPLHIIFLCGSKYSSDPNEKRNVLKRYIESTMSGYHALILEEHFCFANTTKKYLSYDDIFLYSLAQIEELASLFASNIVIIHETISTAAELGMFAINPALVKKICLLSPDDIAIEEKKVSTFIEKAFLVSKAPEMKIGKHIIFYPDIYVQRESKDKSGYWTSFHNNSIGEELGKKLFSFLYRDNKDSKILFRFPKFGASNQHTSSIDCHINKKAKEVSINICAEILKILLLSIFLQDTFMMDFNIERPIKDHVTDVEKIFCMLMWNSISFISELDISSYKVKISIKNTTCNIRQAIGYFIYMLQGIGMIKMEQTQTVAPEIRKILPTSNLETLKKAFPPLISECSQTAFGRLMK